MNQDSRIKLVTALTAERNALRDFVGLLEREQNTLVENLTDQLLTLAEQKSAAAQALTKLIEARHALLNNALPESSSASIQTWLQTHNAAAWPIWQEVRGLTERARQLNQSSGELIQMKLRYNKQALTVLGNAVSKANLYGPDGQPNLPNSGLGRTLGSG
ncbi:MAG: FlgN family protein [Candidatus Gallionella acididurans]|uniref:FlgN family protein n=1 Tax=Candidatus Gallionella acididurans TaxID=1796491 RepID=A0A139BXT8_9PROT|nr:MAG: FlgN family protein [Candidatus Gallionella acididurans]